MMCFAQDHIVFLVLCGFICGKNLLNVEIINVSTKSRIVNFNLKTTKKVRFFAQI